MLRTRLVIFASAVGLVLSAFAPLTAHASLDLTCRSDLLKDRFEAVDAVIDASHNFTRDVTSFIDIKASDVLELQSDYRSALRDLRLDLRDGLSDIADARSDAAFDLRSSCDNTSLIFRQRQLAFYTRMDNRLTAVFRKARAALRKAYLAEVLACCNG